MKALNTKMSHIGQSYSIDTPPKLTMP